MLCPRQGLRLSISRFFSVITICTRRAGRAFCAVIVPRCSRTARLAMDKPRSIPSVRVEEGFEDLGERFLPHSRAVVADRNGGDLNSPQENVNGGLFRRITDCVAQHILEGAAKEFTIAGNFRCGFAFHPY